MPLPDTVMPSVKNAVTQIRKQKLSLITYCQLVQFAKFQGESSYTSLKPDDLMLVIASDARLIGANNSAIRHALFAYTQLTA